MERIFSRIVRRSEPSVDDFKSARDLGKPLRNPKFARQWAEGISVYDTFDYAVAQARLYRYRLGRFVVAVHLPTNADRSVTVEQTGEDPRHFTLYGSPGDLLRCVRDAPRRADEE